MALCRSINDEQPCSHCSGGAVRFGVVGDLIAHARFQDEAAAVFQFGMQLAFEAEQDVAFTHQWSAR